MLPRRISKTPKRASRWRSQAHTGHVRSFCCAMCGSSTNVVAAHYRLGSGAGGAQKPDDWLTTPLCEGPFSNAEGLLGCHDVQHGMGEESFWQKYAERHGQTVDELIADLIKASPRRAQIEQEMRERANG